MLRLLSSRSKDNLRITAKPRVAVADSSPPLAAKALDEVRAGESRRMASEGRTPLLKKSRWLLLKREENLKGWAALPAARPPPLQPEDRPRLPAQGSLPATLGLQLARLGRQVRGRMVSPDHAFPHRAHEEDRSLPAPAPGSCLSRNRPVISSDESELRVWIIKQVSAFESSVAAPVRSRQIVGPFRS